MVTHRQNGCWISCLICCCWCASRFGSLITIQFGAVMFARFRLYAMQTFNKFVVNGHHSVISRCVSFALRNDIQYVRIWIRLREIWCVCEHCREQNRRPCSTHTHTHTPDIKRKNKSTEWVIAMPTLREQQCNQCRRSRSWWKRLLFTDTDPVALANPILLYVLRIARAHKSHRWFLCISHARMRRMQSQWAMGNEKCLPYKCLFGECKKRVKAEHANHEKWQIKTRADMLVPYIRCMNVCRIYV